MVQRGREKVELTKGGRLVKHGLASSYNNHKCGCDECRAAWAKYMLQRVRDWRHKDKTKGVKINL